MTWYRWSVVIVGRESGHRSSVPFIRFRHQKQAIMWCVRMNAQHLALSDLTYFEPEQIVGKPRLSNTGRGSRVKQT